MKDKEIHDQRNCESRDSTTRQTVREISKSISELCFPKGTL